MSTSVHVTLVAHAPTDAQRHLRFPSDEGIEELAAARAVAARSAVGRYAACRRGPELRNAETAAVLGLAAIAEARLRAWDLGTWTGRAVAAVAEHDPEGFNAWRTDPTAASHGGESLRALLARVDAWLRDQVTTGGRTLIVADASVVRAVVACGLGLPAEAYWRFDIRPLSLTTLQHHDGVWRARVVGAAVDG